MNRHYPASAEEVWSSFEWLLKDDLERIDYRVRQMFKELGQLRSLKDDQIREFLHERFVALWQQVAAEQENQAKYRRTENAENTNTRSGRSRRQDDAAK